VTPVATFTIAADHPSLAGHFPDRPVVPGVVLLDHVLSAIAPSGASGLPSVKFIQPVLPGQPVVIACAPASDRRIAFSCTVDGHAVARGSVSLGPG
jgi:3-hydroxymyristoyl/3-hydroxydecanoyl-(acyl carrier protein) dehydratase